MASRALTMMRGFCEHHGFVLTQQQMEELAEFYLFLKWRALQSLGEPDA